MSLGDVPLRWKILANKSRTAFTMITLPANNISGIVVWREPTSSFQRHLRLHTFDDAGNLDGFHRVAPESTTELLLAITFENVVRPFF